MFVCLCMGVTSNVVSEAVANGATTSKQIAEACGAGGDCGRCRRTLRAIIAAHCETTDSPCEMKGSHCAVNGSQSHAASR
ncbi:(2Fe-2S)-binding protein, partial [Mycolicibacterium sp. XJ1819]